MIVLWLWKNHLRQISKNTSKRHIKTIEQLQKQQENVPKNDEATASTKPTEPTTQTPLTPTSFDDKNDAISL
jgi:cytoskeletal protein RodZ